MGGSITQFANSMKVINSLDDIAEVAYSNSSQSAQTAAVNDMTKACQIIAGELVGGPEEATGFLALAGVAVAMATAKAAEQTCQGLSQVVVDDFLSAYNAAEQQLNADEDTDQLNQQQSSDISSLNTDVSAGNVAGTISAANQLMEDSNFVGVTDNDEGISYSQNGLSLSLSTSWKPITLDVENSDGSSNITVYNADGSSTTTYYTGSHGSGSIKEIDQENEDGTSQITLYNSGGSSTTTYYSGPNGTGTVIGTSQQSVGFSIAYTSAEEYENPYPPNLSAPSVGILTGTFIADGQKPSGNGTITIDVTGTLEWYGVTYEAGGYIVYVDGAATSWNIGAKNTTSYIGGGIIYITNTGDNGTLTGTSTLSPSFINNTSGTFAITGDFTTETLLPASGQSQSLDDELNALADNDETLQTLLIGGSGAVTLSGSATIADVTITAGGVLQLEGGILDTDPITVDSGGNITGYGTITGAMANSGTITASGGVLDITGDVTGSGTLVIDGGASLLLEGDVAATESIVFDGGSASLLVGSGADIQATVSGLAAGDAIDLEELAYVSGGSAVLEAGNLLEVTAGGTSYDLQLDSTQDFSDDSFMLAADSGGTGALVTMEGTPCYCRGTRILTDRGEVPVEELTIGDCLVTQSGETRPLRWIGRRAYAGRFAARNCDVLPILIQPGALADGMPMRDLYVSPLHAMFVDGVLIPAKYLVNGGSIRQVMALESVEYFHLELATHDVIIAEGAPAESFLNDRNRGMFHNAAEYDALYPDEEPVPAAYCAERVEHGERLAEIRARLSVRGLAIGYRAGGSITTTLSAGRNNVLLPPGIGELRLISPSALQQGDVRQLGALIAAVAVDTVPMDIRDARFAAGFHAVEAHVARKVRWTNGDARMQLDPDPMPRWIDIDVVAVNEQQIDQTRGVRAVG